MTRSDPTCLRMASTWVSMTDDIVQVGDGRVDAWRARRVDGGRSAAEDDADGPPGPDLLGRDRVRHDLRIHVRVTHPPGDELGVLGTEVDDQDGVERLRLDHAPGYR